ncbi:enoyl-CoA hydratase/isomerase family protein [Hansschlegelia zhihuaiae]|uniref:Enoyl-CoA hydratase/isomerase family protein n=1 Tax=Hansschlegelia zhihuaiae TaxID=405005 RepID=A0A4Q0MCA8_9HYPH|nr:enoyl-CoA hydratase/isomerase family protein [Hansschlegelia zhihuaiae]RXF70978.1 enoyl-CoA hydratase/isomerase family protein [Hansschlegelia zhihuaiae]
MDGTALREGPVRVRLDGPEGLRTIAIDRPAKANALDAETVEALAQAVAEAAQAGAPFGFGSDGRVFCGGFDFTGVDEQSQGDLLLRFVRIEALLQAVAHAPTASFAFVGGAAFGAGADLASICAYRIGSPEAKFRFPGFRFGVALGTRRLAVTVGPDAARSILLENRTVGAEEALELGLLTHLVDRSEFDATAARLLEAHRGLSEGAAARVLGLTIPDTRDADMAELVRSLEPDGLHDRIARYRSGHR